MLFSCCTFFSMQVSQTSSVCFILNYEFSCSVVTPAHFVMFACCAHRDQAGLEREWTHQLRAIWRMGNPSPTEKTSANRIN